MKGTGAVPAMDAPKKAAAAAIRDAIPADEAVFYAKEASSETELLARLQSIEEVASVSDSLSFAGLARLCRARDGGVSFESFPDPRRLWLGATFDCLAEHEALEFLAPLRNKSVLQLGGKGTEAVKLMLGGARAGYVVSPVESELDCARELARLCGVKLACHLGLAEEIPFPDGSFDAVYAPGCAHHFQTEEAFPEIARVLRPGGRFAAVEPWRAPFYALGIKIFGKREKDVNCSPLTRERVESLGQHFLFHKVRLHGTLSRYALIALGKLGWTAPLETAWRVMGADDALCSLLRLRSCGSSIALLAEK